MSELPSLAEALAGDPQARERHLLVLREVSRPIAEPPRAPRFRGLREPAATRLAALGLSRYTTLHGPVRVGRIES